MFVLNQLCEMRAKHYDAQAALQHVKAYGENIQKSLDE